MAQAQSTTVKPQSTFDKTYTFRLRRHKGGSFHGLWELAILKDDQQARIKKTISDADALNFCLDNLMGELEADGY